MKLDMSMDEFINKLADIENEVIDQCQIGVDEVAEDLLNVSAQLSPLEYGSHMESGSVTPSDVNGNEVSAEVGYGEEYSLWLHEATYNLGETSRKKPNVEGMTVGRKYLEQPVNQKGEKYAEHIMSKVGELFD